MAMYTKSWVSATSVRRACMGFPVATWRGCEALDAASAKADEILGLFSALLRIAQIEGGERRAAFAALDLAALLAQMRELFEPVADEAGDVLQLANLDKAVIRGDRQLLVQLF